MKLSSTEEQHLKSQLAQIATHIDTSTRALWPDDATAYGGVQVRQAAQYSLLAGGKRMRPFLVYHVAKALGADIPEDTLNRVAVAVEALHTFTLIHDDLPCIDNDDLRRGNPTCHTKFDEATATLAGDWLHGWALELILADACILSHEKKLAMTTVLVRALQTVIEGEMWDILAELGQQHTLTQEDLAQLQKMKTGALFTACVHVGGILGDATEHQHAALAQYAAHVGLAFQMIDDVLDETASTEELGKTAGKDMAQGKVTFTTLLGLEATRRAAEQEIQAALKVIQPLDDANGTLGNLARYIWQRGQA